MGSKSVGSVRWVGPSKLVNEARQATSANDEHAGGEDMPRSSGAKAVHPKSKSVDVSRRSKAAEAAKKAKAPAKKAPPKKK
tara:strand:- start:169 stop:411 length:243 start_codon:yes stop_codon:yes gene_type:complete